MTNYPILIGSDALGSLGQWLQQHPPSQVLVLTDNHTSRHCYPLLAPHLPNHHTHTIPAGEGHKQISTCQNIWQAMTDLALDRKALVINLGGGVIGDMGGFTAATYKRGVSFIQVPTTLLAQVDASVGGKLGIDFQGLKNHIGLYREPAGVYINPDFLRTLPFAELRSGMAEVIKHHLIADQPAWQQFRQQQDMKTLDLEALIHHSVRIKGEIVAADPQERGQRKALNFGHTVGHALETVRLDQANHLLHGEAIAVGMVAEAYLSRQHGHLSESDLEDITDFLMAMYPPITIQEAELAPIAQLARQDKKNEGGRILCTFLDGIGSAMVNQPIEAEDVMAGLRYYQRVATKVSG